MFIHLANISILIFPAMGEVLWQILDPSINRHWAPCSLKFLFCFVQHQQSLACFCSCQFTVPLCGLSMARAHAQILRPSPSALQHGTSSGIARQMMPFEEPWSGYSAASLDITQVNLAMGAPLSYLSFLNPLSAGVDLLCAGTNQFGHFICRRASWQDLDLAMLAMPLHVA